MNLIQARQDLEQQVLEHCRKVLTSAHRMIHAETDWARDQFYFESMRHMAMMEQQLGVWRCQTAAMQRKPRSEETI